MSSKTYNKKISWKISLPLGLIFWIVGYGGVLVIAGMLITGIGIVNMYQELFYKKDLDKKSQPIIRVIFFSVGTFIVASIFVRVIVMVLLS